MAKAKPTTHEAREARLNGNARVHHPGDGLTKRELIAAMLTQGLLTAVPSRREESVALAVKHTDALLLELECTRAKAKQ